MNYENNGENSNKGFEALFASVEFGFVEELGVGI